MFEDKTQVFDFLSKGEVLDNELKAIEESRLKFYPTAGDEFRNAEVIPEGHRQLKKVYHSYMILKRLIKPVWNDLPRLCIRDPEPVNGIPNPGTAIDYYMRPETDDEIAKMKKIMEFWNEKEVEIPSDVEKCWLEWTDEDDKTTLVHLPREIIEDSEIYGGLIKMDDFVGTQENPFTLKLDKVIFNNWINFYKWMLYDDSKEEEWKVFIEKIRVHLFEKGDTYDILHVYPGHIWESIQELEHTASNELNNLIRSYTGPEPFKRRDEFPHSDFWKMIRRTIWHRIGTDVTPHQHQQTDPYTINYVTRLFVFLRASEAWDIHHNKIGTYIGARKMLFFFRMLRFSCETEIADNCNHSPVYKTHPTYKLALFGGVVCASHMQVIYAEVNGLDHKKLTPLGPTEKLELPQKFIDEIYESHIRPKMSSIDVSLP